jgi:hypothetical protein
MGFQGSLEALMKAFIGFYIACVAVGRPDIPLKAIAHLQAKAMQGVNASWGCPSVFHKNACGSYDSRRYR